MAHPFIQAARQREWLEARETTRRAAKAAEMPDADELANETLAAAQEDEVVKRRAMFGSSADSSDQE